MTRILIFILSFCGVFTYAAVKVVFPSPDILGLSAAKPLSILHKSNQSKIEPKEVRFVMCGGLIDEVQAIYCKETSFDRVANDLQEIYTGFEVLSLRRDDFRFWKVDPKKFVIQLSVIQQGDLSISEGDKLVIFKRITSRKNK